MILKQRKYLRLDSVFPVEFRLISLGGEKTLSDWIQGFTHNVSKGGIRLDVNNLKTEIVTLIKKQEARFSLQIRMPLNRPPINAQAKVIWVRDNPEGKDAYFIGLVFDNIESVYQRRLIHYALLKKMSLAFLLTVIFILGLGLVLNSHLNMKLFRDNKALVSQLMEVLQGTNIAKEKIREINKDKDELQLKIDALKLRLETIEQERGDLAQKVKVEEDKAIQKIEELNRTIEKLNYEKLKFQEQLTALEQKESAVTEELLRLDEKKVVLEKANFDKMYQWLVIHQNPRTGLVISYEGDSDIANWAFIYDQSLVLQAYTNSSDFERAKKLLDFFQRKAKKQAGLFYNAYYANDGSVAEYTLHSGPNIWLGIAIIQYSKKTADYKYFSLAEEIASTIIALQMQDKDRGIRGGPDIGWYSTEHNLDAYAFFNMLYKIVAKEVYRDARDKVLNWLIQNTYSKTDIPIKRGRGDSTIATDTYAWSIASIGPQKLNALGMNPDKIMEFAQEQCAVEVLFLRPDGSNVKVKGFDFAPQRHLPRGGAISTEWTAQMIISFRIMADFYHKKQMTLKANWYEQKADEYLGQLCNMIISSSSPSGQGESCLPYASSDFVDTGHGWSTPKGRSTGSVSATTYTLFAYYHYNPLENEDVSQ